MGSKCSKSSKSVQSSKCCRPRYTMLSRTRDRKVLPVGIWKQGLRCCCLDSNWKVVSAYKRVGKIKVQNQQVIHASIQFDVLCSSCKEKYSMAADFLPSRGKKLATGGFDGFIYEEEYTMDKNYKDVIKIFEGIQPCNGSNDPQMTNGQQYANVFMNKVRRL